MLEASTTSSNPFATRCLRFKPARQNCTSAVARHLTEYFDNDKFSLPN